MIRYRFKTEQEFINEFGQDWREVGSKFVKPMDFLLGKELEQETIYSVIQYNRYNEKIEFSNENDHFNYYGWSISKHMIKEIKTIPTYNEKKRLVYD